MNSGQPIDEGQQRPRADADVGCGRVPSCGWIGAAGLRAEVQEGGLPWQERWRFNDFLGISKKRPILNQLYLKKCT